MFSGLIIKTTTLEKSPLVGGPILSNNETQTQNIDPKEHIRSKENVMSIVDILIIIFDYLTQEELLTMSQVWKLFLVVATKGCLHQKFGYYDSDSIETEYVEENDKIEEDFDFDFERAPLKSIKISPMSIDKPTIPQRLTMKDNLLDDNLFISKQFDDIPEEDSDWNESNSEERIKNKSPHKQK